MAKPNLDGRDRSARRGYVGAIFLSALGHAVFFASVLFIIPSYLRHPNGPPPSYTVKIVDNLPAGDLGTHLPRLTQEHRRRSQRHTLPKKPRVEHSKLPPPPKPPADDKHVIALNTHVTPTPTPTPKPTPKPTAKPTAAPKPRHTRAPRPTPSAVRHRRRATPKPTPKRAERHKREAHHRIETAHAKPTPSVKERLASLKEKLLKEHLSHNASSSGQAKTAPGRSKGGGPVVAKISSSGAGSGIGPGEGSAGIQQDLQFLLYYRTVQKRIKKAWSFAGGSGNLTTSVIFAIGPDGNVTGVKLEQSSQDPAFDDSVIRAIRRASPFPAPPEKYRSEFARGVEAVFKLGDLKS